MSKSIRKSSLLRIVTSSVLIAVLSVSSFACSKTPEKTEKETEETETEGEMRGSRLDSDVKITEESTAETKETTFISETTPTNSESIEPEQSYPPPVLGNEIQFFPTWAENRASVGVQSVSQCRMARIIYYNEFPDWRNQAYDYIQTYISHPNAIHIYVYDDFNSDLGDYLAGGQEYYLELDGVVFPDATNMVVFEGWHSLLAELYCFRLYIDSDFIPDEDGVIHGYAYITDKISEYDNSFSFGLEIDVANLVQFNEWVLAMGLAEPDSNYQGEYSDIYNQYPSLPSDFNGYPLGLGLSDLFYCVGYEYHPDFDYSSYTYWNRYS